MGPLNFAPAIAEPEFLPLVENIKVQGTPLGAAVSWTLPNLAGFDVDGLHFRVIEATSGRHGVGAVLYLLSKQSVLQPRPMSCRSVSIMCTGLA